MYSLRAFTQVVSVVPSTLSSVCLNANGLATVIETNTLGALLSLFTVKKYRKVMRSSDTASRLGSSMDELMRYHPSLRPIGIRAVVDALKRLIKLGGSEIQSAAETKKQEHELKSPKEMEVSTDDQPAQETHGQAEPSPDETVVLSITDTTAASLEETKGKDEGTEMKDVHALPAFVDPELETDVEPSTISEYIGNFGRFLETLFVNSEHGRYFIENEGIDLMLQLYELPKLSASFPGSPAAHSLSLAFRSLSAHHASVLLRCVLNSIHRQFSALESLHPNWRNGLGFIQSSKG